MSILKPTPEEREAEKRRFLKQWDHFTKRCYADSQSCISCGCDPSKYYACPAHAGSRRYQNELMRRMVIAQEKLAEK